MLIVLKTIVGFLHVDFCHVGSQLGAQYYFLGGWCQISTLKISEYACGTFRTCSYIWSQTVKIQLGLDRGTVKSFMLQIHILAKCWRLGYDGVVPSGLAELEQLQSISQSVSQILMSY